MSMTLSPDMFTPHFPTHLDSSSTRWRHHEFLGKHLYPWISVLDHVGDISRPEMCSHRDRMRCGRVSHEGVTVSGHFLLICRQQLGVNRTQCGRCDLVQEWHHFWRLVN